MGNINCHSNVANKKNKRMKEIDNWLNQWVKNSIIRKRFRNIILKEINKHKLNTNVNG